jgi:hypothetical protein
VNIQSGDEVRLKAGGDVPDRYDGGWFVVLSENVEGKRLVRADGGTKEQEPLWVAEENFLETHPYIYTGDEPPPYEPLPDEDIKEVATKLHGGTIFTSMHLPESERVQMHSSVFMCVIFQPRDQIIWNLRNDIQVLWEDIGKAGSMAINGYPTFFSHHILSGADWRRVITKHGQIKEALAAL